jgi:hypothetical protein
MATDIVGGLFGITPQSYERQLSEQGLAQGEQLGAMSPDAFGRSMLYAGGAQLGRGIGGALGAEDPQLKLISARNAVLREVDPTDPESIMAGAQRLAPFDPQGASSLATMAREATLKASQVTKNLRESRAAGIGPEGMRAQREAQLQQALRQLQLEGVEQTPEVKNTIQLYKDELSALQRGGQGGLPAIAKLQAYRDQLVDQLGENDPKVKAVDQAIKAETLGKGTTINVDTRQPIEISKNKTDLAAEIEKGAFTASDRITLAQNLRSLLPKAFVGVGSDVILQGARVAEAFGIDVKGVAPSQIVDTILNEMTIGKAGELKGALSDKDREFLKATIGTRGLSIKTLNYVADEIERRASIDRKLNTRVNEAIKAKKNLNEIDFAEERSLANKDVQKDLTRLRELRQKAGQQQ